MLDKWRSNRSNVVLQNTSLLPGELELGEYSETTVLELRWIPSSDELVFKFRPSAMLGRGGAS